MSHYNKRSVSGTLLYLIRKSPELILDSQVWEAPSKESFVVENCVFWIICHLISGIFTDKNWSVSKSDVRGSLKAAEFIRNIVKLVIFEHCNSTVGDPNVDANRNLFSFECAWGCTRALWALHLYVFHPLISCTVCDVVAVDSLISLCYFNLILMNLWLYLLLLLQW